jgi:hypothetical protein
MTASGVHTLVPSSSTRIVDGAADAVAPRHGERGKAVGRPRIPEASAEEQTDGARGFKRYRQALRMAGPWTGMETLHLAILASRADNRTGRVEGYTLERLCTGELPRSDLTSEPAAFPQKTSKQSFLRSLRTFCDLAIFERPDGERVPVITRITTKARAGVKNDINIYVFNDDALDYWTSRPRPEAWGPPKKVRVPADVLMRPGTAPTASCADASEVTGTKDVNVIETVDEVSGAKVGPAAGAVPASTCTRPPGLPCATPLPQMKKSRRRPLAVRRAAPLRAAVPVLATLAEGHFDGDESAATAAALAHYAEHLGVIVLVPAPAVAPRAAPPGEHLLDRADPVLTREAIGLAIPPPVVHEGVFVDEEEPRDGAVLQNGDQPKLSLVAKRLDAEILDIARAFPPLAPLATELHAAEMGASARKWGKSIEEVQVALERLVFKIHRGDHPRLATLDRKPAEVELLKLARGFIRGQWTTTDCAPLPDILGQIRPKLQDPTPEDRDLICAHFSVSREELAVRRHGFDERVDACRAELGKVGAYLRGRARAVLAVEDSMAEGETTAVAFQLLAGEIEHWDPADLHAMSVPAEAVRWIRLAAATGSHSARTKALLELAASKIEGGEHRSATAEPPGLGALQAEVSPSVAGAPDARSERAQPSDEARAVFGRAVDHTRQIVPAFDQWFVGVQFDGLVGEVLSLRARDEFTLGWVTDKFLSVLTGKLCELMGSGVQVVWTIDRNLDAPIAKPRSRR